MALDFTEVFAKYESLVQEADKLFEQVKQATGERVHCGKTCSDCCYALFDLSLVEACYINAKFNEKFSGARKSEIKEVADATDRKLYQIKKKAFQASQSGTGSAEILRQLAETKVRCPFLGEDDLCVLYEHRPITCRLYGIPFGIGGTAHTCSKSGFTKGEKYPSVNMDKINDRLFGFSYELAKSVQSGYSRIWEMLVPLSMAVLNSYDEEYFKAGKGNYEELEQAKAQAPVPSPEPKPAPQSDCGQDPETCGVSGGCASCNGGYTVTLGKPEE